jgi:hypothetical protein
MAKKITTEAQALAFIKNDGSLEDVPLAFRTAKVCLAAVTKDGVALYDVPEKLRTAELCLAAVTQDGYGPELAN